MAAQKDDASTERVKLSVRLEPAGWLMLCRVADAYYEGKRHSAADAALLDAVVGGALPFPKEPTAAFAKGYAATLEAVAQRLSNTSKVFHYGADVSKALIKLADEYQTLDLKKLNRALPFSRRLTSGAPAVPTAPWTLTIPQQWAGDVPSNDLRKFADAAFIAHATHLDLDGLPKKTLQAPKALPSLASILTGRYMDPALVGLLAGLPYAAPSAKEGLGTPLRWLRSVLAQRAA